MKIPEENTKEAIDIRRKIISTQLSKLIDKSIYCPCLGVKVIVVRKSITEIATWASRRFESTVAAIDLENQLRIARFYAKTDPKPGQKKRFKFISMYELHGTLNAKTTKIMVGVRNCGTYLQYCITVKE